MNPLRPFLPRGRAPRTILSGPMAGIRLHLDLQSELLIWLGTYERETFRDLRFLLRGCRGAADLGAAKGDLAVLLLRQPGMERVVAVEPLERELELLRSNLALNGLAADPRLHIHAGFAGQGAPPRWRTLDDLAAGLPPPVFIKVDVDGPEADVLSGGRDLLRRHDCRLLVETHSLEAEEACMALLRELGYQVSVIRPAWWRVILPERRPLPHNRWLAAWRARN